nr:A-kinase anchor protein 9 isoform X3 [Parasteatoda tepidariorum]XP_042909909.1 A-kinase anchor protein 9 isoform X3 [Parasteatoda tepidariorum]
MYHTLCLASLILLAKFQKKQSAKNKRLPKSTDTDSSFQCSSLKDADDKSEATDSSSNSSINTMKEKSETSLEAVMDSSPIEESAFPIAEDVSDDGDPLLHAKQTALVSCLEQKLSKYQDACNKKDAMIKQLSHQLASSVRASEAESSETVEKFKEEMNMLHLQLSKTTSMIQKQNSKSNGKETLQGPLSDQVPCSSEIGIQVETPNTINLENNVINLSKTLTSSDTNDSIYKEQYKTPGDVLSVLKKIDSLTAITKLIESVADISVQSINESSDFSPSKFQSLFLKRLNSAESEATQIDISESESQLSDINYADELFFKDNSQSHVEKMHCRTVPQNLNLVTDFLHGEMENINSILSSLRAGPQGDMLFFDKSTSFKSISETEDLGDKSLNSLNFHEVLQQKSKLEAKILHLQHLQSGLKDISLENRTIENDNFTNSDDNLIMEEPPLSCVSLLSLTDSEYRTECITTDSEANFSRKVSLDSSRPAYDRDYCPKCDKYFELVKEKYDDHLCLLKESLENNLNLEKNEAVKKLELEIDKIKSDKDNMQEQMAKQIELLCQEQEMKIQQIINENQKQLSEIQKCQDEWLIEKEQLLSDIKEYEKLLSVKDKELHEAWDEKNNIEISLQKQIADLVEEHQEDLEARHLSTSEQFSQERKKLELEHLSALNDLKRLHEDTTGELRMSCAKELHILKKSHAEELDEHKKSLAKELSELQKAHAEELGKLQKAHVEELGKLQKAHAEELGELQKAHAEELGELQKAHAAELGELQKSHDEKLGELTKKIDEVKVSHVKELEEFKMSQVNELDALKMSHAKELKETEMRLRKEHSESINFIEANHSEECVTYQKRIENLLEEKCELLNKTTQEYEALLKKNHKALVKLCNQLRTKIVVHKKKILDDSFQSLNSELDVSVADTLDVLNKSIENGLVKYLESNYFAQEIFEETQYLELQSQLYEDDLPRIIVPNKRKEKIQKIDVAIQHGGPADVEKLSASEGSLSSISLGVEDIELIHSKTAELQKDFQRDIATYMEVNEQLRSDLLSQQDHNQELEKRVKCLESKIQEKDKELSEKESQLHSMENGSIKGGLAGSQLSSSDIRSWQVDVAQTNSRLLHVLSDLVKTFMDIESDINRHLYEHGLIPSRTGTLGHHDEETGHSVGSREDFASLSFGECPNLELAEDGPDLTPRAWDLFSAVGTYDHEMEGEDVVLGASRRLRQAVDHVLNLLTRALDNQQNQDLKLLLKRNEELSQELQDETKSRDDLHLQLIATEGTLRKLENEKQKLQDTMADLTENIDMLKREVTIERNKVTYLTQEKEAANDEVQTLRNQCELLASRLGDPEKMSTNKTLQSEVIHVHEKPELLHENSKLSSEKHNVQINLSKERQSFQDRLQQMEMAIEDLTAEKEEIMERMCKEIRDLKAEMEAMEKQLQSNKKFIEEQAQEREQEREDYLKELNKMQETLREKEKIQSNEAKLMKEIESLEQSLRSRIEDHKSTMQKKDAVENELRQHVDKIRDLRDVIEELEKQLNIKTKMEMELQRKLSSLTETVNAHERRNSLLDDELTIPKDVITGDESTEHFQNLKDKLAFQSQEIEEMSQNRTLLQELRGQIHFLEAKVEQRVKQLETAFLSSGSPILSSDASPTSSHESETMHLPCEDGWEMSPRSIHWLEVRRLEEKFGRLTHIDEELIKRNKELETKLKKLLHAHEECELENGTLQEKLSDQMMQVSILKSHIEEQKHRPITPLKSHALSKQLEELKEAYHSALEKIDQMTSLLDERSDEIRALNEEVAKGNYTLASLQKTMQTTINEKEEIDKSKKQIESDLSCFKYLVLEKDEELKKNSDLVKRLQDQVEELQNQTNSLSVLPDIEKEMISKNGLIENLQKENADLKELIENSKKELDSEKDQVEVLFEQIATLSQENKKLEEDLDIVHSMMQQKERELATLHEETDPQIKLEAELESLEKELESQKFIEEDLRAELLKMESELEASNNVLKQESEQWKSRLKDLETSHQLEIENLKNQLEIYKKTISSVASEDIDLASLRNEIMEATKIIRFENPSDNKDYSNLVYSVLKKAVDSKLMQTQKEHEANVSSIHENWQHKIEDEYVDKSNVESLRKKYKKELHERLKKEAADKDSYWQSRLEELKNSLKESYDEQLSKELNFLQSKLKEITSEKTRLEIQVRKLTQQVEKLVESLKIQKEKIPALKEKFTEKYERELKMCEENSKKKLELEVKCALEQEKERHQEEIAELQKMYEKRWSSEMQKIMTNQMEELKKLSNNKKINLQAVYNQFSTEFNEQLKKVQNECLSQMKEERQRFHAEHKEDLQKIELDLQKQFEKEKKSLLLTKEKEIATFSQALKERMAEISKLKASLLNKDIDSWEEEKTNLVSEHKKEIEDLKHKYERFVQNHNAEVKNMEEAYNHLLEEVYELLKIAKRAATGSVLSDSGSNRTATPSSEITSSDEACSSCRDDMLIGNKNLLADKIYQEGKRILNLVDSSDLTSGVEKEACLWLEERTYVDGKLRHLINKISDANLLSLKEVVDVLCEEVLHSRELVANSDQEISSLQKKCAELQDQVTDYNAKINFLTTNLTHQVKLNTELDAQLTFSVNEASALRRSIEETRVTTLESTGSHTQKQSINSSSSSYDMGRLRSADTPKSAQNFSMFLPEIGSSPPVKLNNTEEMYPESVKSLLELTNEILNTPEEIELPESSLSFTTQMSSIPQQLSNILKEEGISSSFEVKIHGLYWVYRKTLSHNKSLLYQKKYLLMLLRGYQLTEKMTLSCVNQMGKNIMFENNSHSSFTSVDSPVRGRVLFRSVAYVVVAIQRMKYYVRRWKLFAKVPTSDIVKAEVNSIFQNYRSSSPNSFNMSYLSLSSRSASVCESEKVHAGINSSASSISSRSGTKSKRKSKADKGKLLEYVQRLDTLQKQLGLDSLR